MISISQLILSPLLSPLFSPLVHLFMVLAYQLRSHAHMSTLLASLLRSHPNIRIPHAPLRCPRPLLSIPHTHLRYPQPSLSYPQPNLTRSQPFIRPFRQHHRKPTLANPSLSGTFATHTRLTLQSKGSKRACQPHRTPTRNDNPYQLDNKHKNNPNPLPTR